MQARATLAPQMYFCVEVVRKLFTDKPSKHSVRRKNWKKKKKIERKRCLKLPRVRGGFWQSSAEKMGRPAQLQPKRQPSEGRQLLLLNTKRPENRGSRQIFCPTQPVRAKFFRHVSELWTWSMQIDRRSWDGFVGRKSRDPVAVGRRHFGPATPKRKKKGARNKLSRQSGASYGGQLTRRTSRVRGPAKERGWTWWNRSITAAPTKHAPAQRIMTNRHLFFFHAPIHHPTSRTPTAQHSSASTMHKYWFLTTAGCPSDKPHTCINPSAVQYLACQQEDIDLANTVANTDLIVVKLPTQQKLW